MERVPYDVRSLLKARLEVTLVDDHVELVLQQVLRDTSGDFR